MFLYEQPARCSPRAVQCSPWMPLPDRWEPGRRWGSDVMFYAQKISDDLGVIK